MRDILHSNQLRKGNNIKVFDEIYNRIDAIVVERVKMELQAFNIKPDNKIIEDILNSRSEYYYKEIFDIVNLVLNKWNKKN